MKRLVIGTAAALVAATAFASTAAAQCWLPPAYQLTFMRRPAAETPLTSPRGESAQPSDLRLSYGGPEVAAGFNYGFSDPSGQSTVDADIALGVTDWLRSSLGVGVCDPRFPDTGRSFVLGGTVAAQVLGAADSPLGVLAQVGISRYSIDDETVIAVPLIAGLGFAVNDQTNLYAGPMLQYERSSFGGAGYSYSDSETRPGAIAGIEALIRGNWGVNASVALLRVKTEGYDSCFEPGVCYGEGVSSTTDNRVNASLRLVRRLGRHR